MADGQDPFAANVDQAQTNYQRLATLDQDAIASQYPAPGSYDQALTQAQNALTNALRAQATANKQPAPKTQRTQAQEDASTAQAAAANARAGVAAQNANTAAQNANSNTAKGDAAVQRAGAYAGWTQARIDLAKQSAWAKVQPQLDAIDAQWQSGELTDEQRDEAKQGVVNQAIADTVSGMTAPQRQTAQYQQDSLAVNQGNNRASNSASIVNNALDAVNKGMAGAAPGQGTIGANAVQAMLSAGQQNQTAMAGAPMDISHAIDIGKQLLAGVDPKTAILGTAIRAGVVPTPPFVAPSMTYDPNTDNTHPVGSIWDNPSGQWVNGQGQNVGTPGNQPFVAGVRY